MNTAYAYKPVKFFVVTFCITWAAWFAAAFLSRQGTSEACVGALMGLGLLGPLASALVMVFGSGSLLLKRDFRSKLANPKRIRPVFLPAIFLLMPLTMLLSIAFSLPLGGSADQFRPSAHFGIVEGRPLLSLVIPFLAPALEELGWSGYGIDSLRSRFGMLSSAVFFGVLWSLWHLPLFFIEGYYHYNLLQAHPVYALNFFVSVVPMTVVTNWIYFKNGRSIVAAMVFHAVVVVSSELFQVANSTKCIVTFVLTLFCIAIVTWDKKFFLDGPKNPLAKAD